MRVWLEALSPDFAATVRRFPFAIVLALVGAVLLMLGVNQVEPFKDPYWGRLFIGIAAAAGFSVGGTLFAESRPHNRRWGLALNYFVPLLAIGLAALDDADIAYVYALLPLSGLWASLGGFTRWGCDSRASEERRFWWFNHQAVATACLAVVAFAIIAFGLMAIERAVLILLNFGADQLLFRWVLPIVGVFLTPVYWLSTLPRLDDYREDAFERPDLLALATGLLGQFVLAPLLLVYGLILLVYAGQIAINMALPQGVIGWMVLGFVTVGAATWLVLFPPFLQSRGLVRVFRRSWFWLTVIPLVLFVLAVWVRVDTYGLTPERVMLAGGGVWAIVVTLLFLSGRGDIRLIPGLAAIVLLPLAVGPLNIGNWPVLDQAARLDAAMDRAGVTGPTGDVQWSDADVAIVRSAAAYLYYNQASDRIRDILAEHQVPITSSGNAYDLDTAFALMRLPDAAAPTPFTYDSVSRWREVPADVSATPFLLDRVAVSPGVVSVTASGLSLHLTEAGDLSVSIVGSAAPPAITSLDAWTHAARPPHLVNPAIDFMAGGVRYRYVVDFATIERRAESPQLGRHITYLDGYLFRSVSEITPTP
jgi:MFS family permease